MVRDEPPNGGRRFAFPPYMMTGLRAVGRNEKTRLYGEAGKKKKVRGNFIKTGGYVTPDNIENAERYVPLSEKK
ncbi:hypothetical protein AGMMS49545_18240 [Betaproteobacteria bacterium]|nr:hypothetical protein AGMMS49545_18240 [Betaproteobacteria bacterium]GHU41576.1 hypothetical protein AGMMS50289_04940 [Betaproteobacteria bacterium]